MAGKSSVHSSRDESRASRSPSHVPRASRWRFAQGSRFVPLSSDLISTPLAHHFDVHLGQNGYTQVLFSSTSMVYSGTCKDSDLHSPNKAAGRALYHPLSLSRQEEGLLESGLSDNLWPPPVLMAALNQRINAHPIHSLWLLGPIAVPLS